ncbi:MAG: nucleotidyltransferase [Tepidanaerobacter acetatoxydans]|uniref:Cyclic GMP-AMP synthase n=1 Tax=Tepidanaerobacter acetatoxydans (strain DSM 21804 / JCM 16047 / Re1) TaxID=1209989 RepID=F4LXF3_TEPAE|nr:MULTISPECIES: nucleotidyltransferase [Tepidanaerobacter]AEE91055.1 hypothetical protein TepRe1_0880 [Tepidanaerobacter acetatoxydans Re1]NLU10439.1 nucleotidyltransferase [Tepidanaerobacter acetatoxydans]CDI40527.1 conserved protein of unknown function [Tepidanaerobacter acetatoxydans Re1]
MESINKGLIFEEIGKQLDISPTMYKLAVERYTAVAEYLEENDLKAHFYPQGSFRLGTVTRPIRNGIESDYDIDLVCQILVDKNNTSPSTIKNTVGNLLRKNKRYKKILDEEGRRCWTLIYAEKDGIGFHLDILPSIRESIEIIESLIKEYNLAPRYAESAIAITNKNKIDNLYNWESSNPNGYGLWFDEINKSFYDLVEKSTRKQIYENNRDIFASIDDVPPQLIRTPLQRVIQILKRHRDLRFNGHKLEDDKPISMIITTLVSQIAKNENCLTTDIFVLLKFIALKLAQYAILLSNIEISQQQYAVIKRDIYTGKWYISNPVNPAENFADRWHENDNRKAKAFFQWVNWVYLDLIQNMDKPGFDINSLKNVLGNNVVEKANAKYQSLLLQHHNDCMQSSSLSTVNITSPGKPWG